jgi:hypothetical protein
MKLHSVRKNFKDGDSMYEHETVKKILETAIDSLIDNFVKEPYMHRCEHSIHCELYNMLSVHRALQGMYPIKDTEHKTTLIHKEWPETKPRPEKNGKRGNFDLVILDPKTILDPENIRNCKRDFIHGRIPPAFVVEMGLNYGLEHLTNDCYKLTNSECKNGYLIHLSQPHIGKSIKKEGIMPLKNWIENKGNNHQVAAVVFFKDGVLVKNLHCKTINSYSNLVEFVECKHPHVIDE